MSDQSRLDELLERWEEARELGNLLSPEQLCRDTPHLLEPLRERLKSHASSVPELLEQIRRAAAWPPRQLDDRIPRELERICLRALARLPAERYTTAGDLADDLRKWLMEGEAALGDPEARLASNSSRGTGTGVAILEPVFLDWDFRPTIVEKRRNFCGRRWLLRDLDAWRQSDAFERAMLIVGPPGCGKSAFLAMCGELEPEQSILTCYFCQAETPATLHPGQFVQNLAAGFARAVPGYREQLALDESAIAALAPAQCKADPITALEVGLLGPLARLKDLPRTPGLVLLDALDECLLHESGMTILELLAPRLERFPAWVRIVATTREEPRVMEPRVMERLGGVRVLLVRGDDVYMLELETEG